MISSTKLCMKNRWAESHHDGLVKLGSTLEFNLHRMRFIQLLLSANAIDAINYGRLYFSAFGEKHYSGKSAEDLNQAVKYINSMLLRNQAINDCTIIHQ